MRSDAERLIDIQEGISKIEKYVARGKNTFFDDELVQTWVLFHLQIIGEAARAISEETKVKYAEIEWLRIVGFRNLLVHEYFRVNLDIVWYVVENELSNLKSQIELMLEEI